MGLIENKPTVDGLTEAESEMIIAARKPAYFHFLVRDPIALLSACWLIFLFFAAILGPYVLGDIAVNMNLRLRNVSPGSIESSWMNILGTDALGRSMLARIVVATRYTVGISLSASIAALAIGGIIGLFAGFIGSWPGKIIMRISDVIQSFPSILMAMIVLYMLTPSPVNLVLVLAFTRLPIYIRIARAEVLELRERLFVDAARVLGSSTTQIIFRHIAPMVIPTVVNILTVDFALVMLSESGLSFLGIGIQPPSITWGLMVAHGRNYLALAWWQAFFPGLMIMLTTLSINLLASWARRIKDPLQRWRYQLPKN